MPKSKAMHIHPRVYAETEEIAALKLKFACPACTRDFSTQRGLSIHQAMWCLQDSTKANTQSRIGSLADKAVQKQKRNANESMLEHVVIEGQQLENVYSFEYLGSRMECDGDDRADVKYMMDIT